jgi:hypothetical protein
VRVTSSTVSSFPSPGGSGRSLGVVAAAKEAVTSIVVESPAPGVLVRSLRVPDLVRHDGEDRHPVASSGDLAGFRLVLTPIVGGQDQAPVVAVPALAARKALPAQLTGGSLSGSLFSLPDVAGAKFRVTLVDGDAPEDFDRQTISHGDVVMYAAPSPVGLHIDGPDGAELFAMTGPITSGVTTDVKAALQRHLNATVGEDPLAARVTLRSDVVGSASVLWTTSGGVIERAVEGRISVDTTGDPARLDLPPPHPGRTPTRTVADVTVTHNGMALHPISDPMPIADAGVGGPTVRDLAVVRVLAPEALRDQQLTRVGVVGWPLADCDLSMTVLGRTVSMTGLPAPTARREATLVWFDLGDPLLVDAPIELSLTATRGAFGWIADPDPLVRVAVAVSPAGEQVTVGGCLVDLTGDETVVTGAELAGTDGWDVATDQFCTVSLANAVMEFEP